MMIPVVFSMDHGFVMPTGIAFLSILEHSQDCSLDIIILHDSSVTSDDKDKLKQTLSLGSNSDNKLTFIEMGSAYEGAYVSRGVTHATYFRLQLPWILPQYDKVIYCDGDVIFRRSIKYLYDIDINNYYCAGVKRFQYDGYSYEKHAKKFGIEPSNYINAGVLVMNLAKMRNDSLNLKFEELAKNRYPYFDQDVINIACKNALFGLPFGFNVIPSMDLDEKDIYIVHYAGIKPWDHFVWHWAEWWEVYKKSVFYNPQLERMIADRPFGLKHFLKMNLKWYHPSLYAKLRSIFGQMPI